MGEATISLGLGLGGGKASTISGRPAAGGGFLDTYSVSFDGTDDYMDCGTVTAMNSADSFTLSGWFKFDAHNTLFLTGGINSADRFSFYLKSGGSLGVYLGSGEVLTSGSTLSTGQYYHIAVIKDGNGTSNCTLYIDGSLSDTGTRSQSMPSSAGQNFWVGSSQVFSGYEMNGLVDEVAFWSSALTSTDITAIYNSGAPADLSSLSPVHWWRMGDNDGGTGTTITDQGSGGNNGTLTNGPTFSTTVPS